MATLTVTTTQVTGTEVTAVAAGAGGDDFPNDGATVLKVINGGGGAITVTIDDTGTEAPLGATSFDPDVEVSVPAGATRYIGPFPTARFGSSVGVTYSGVSSVTVVPIKVR